MEIHIQDLVSSIKKEGIDAAKKEAESILADAQKKADSIISDARAEAKKTQEAASKEIELLKQGAIVSAEQAKRDAILSFKTEVQEEFRRILAFDVKKVMSGETLAKLISAAIEGEDPSKYAVEVNEVTEVLESELADKIRNGLELRPARDMTAGFRIASKDGSGFFDCTDDEIARMLLHFFNNQSF